MLPLFEGGTVIDAGFDWITVTAKEADTCKILLDIGEQAATGQEACGWRGRTTGFQGYRGYGVEGCFYGTGREGACLRVSGGIAHHLAPYIAATGGKVTRVDIQATVQLPDDDVNYARRLVDEWRRMRLANGRGAKLHSECHDGWLDGSTATFGKRTASRYTRVYDKHRESAGQYPPGSFRVEVECKRQLADPFFRKLCNRDDHRGACLAAIAGHLPRVGLEPRFPLPPAIEAPVLPRKKTDIQRKLEWLEKVARSVVRECYEAGFHEEATHALYSWLMPLDGDGSAG